MQPEEARWIGERPREPADGEPGGVTCNNCIRRRPLDVREDGVLQGAVFRHAFDDEIAFAQTIDRPSADSTLKRIAAPSSGASRPRATCRNSTAWSRARPRSEASCRARRARPRRQLRQRPARHPTPSGRPRQRQREGDLNGGSGQHHRAKRVRRARHWPLRSDPHIRTICRTGASGCPRRRDASRTMAGKRLSAPCAQEAMPRARSARASASARTSRCRSPRGRRNIPA